MNDGPDAGRLTADWAVLGKHPGQVMGYEVLDGSLPADRAKPYLWSATTGTPDHHDPAEAALPWRVFLGSVRTDPTPVCAAVETTWDGSTDGTGAPSYAWRLLLLDWAQAGAVRLTWSALDQNLPLDELPATGTGVPLHVARPSAGEFAALIDRLGFDWAARVAALLLDNRQIAILPAPGATLPDVTERVRVLDALCSLLPYGCRAWLSAATWTGQSEHTLRLVFAATARTGQVEVRPGSGSPPEPQSAAARTYLSELLRLRAKGRSTAELVEHLLGAVAAIPAQNPEEAVRALREADLVDSVVEDVRQGRGRLPDVQRVLDLYPAQSLGEQRLAVLVPFLARAALGADGGPARAMLQQHWSPRFSHLLAEDVVVSGSTQDSFERATAYLGLMNALEAERPGVFDDLLTALVSAPHQKPEWTGSLIYMVEDAFGRAPDSADRLLIQSREAGLAWLGTWLTDNTRNLTPLVRLTRNAVSLAVGGVSGWLRFAAVLTGSAAPGQATAGDAADFLAADGAAWRVALDIAADQGRPAVIDPMWTRLREAARGPEGAAQLLPALERLAPPDDPRCTPDTAADTDLLRALIAAEGATIPRSMPRLRNLTDPTALDRYASAVARRIDADSTLTPTVVDALFGETPEHNTWQVLCLLMRRRPSIEPTVCDHLDARLSVHHRLWLELPLPDDLVTILGRRHHLGWLRTVRDFRETARGEAPYDLLARIVVDGSPADGLPPQLLGEIIDWMIEGGPWQVYFLTTEMDLLERRRGLRLYAELRRVERARPLCEQLYSFSHGEVAHHHRIMESLNGVSEPARQPQPPAPPSHRPAVPSPPSAPAPQQLLPPPPHSVQQPQPHAPQPQSVTPQAQQTGRGRHGIGRLVPKRPEWFRGMR